MCPPSVALVITRNTVFAAPTYIERSFEERSQILGKPGNGSIHNMFALSSSCRCSPSSGLLPRVLHHGVLVARYSRAPRQIWFDQSYAAHIAPSLCHKVYVCVCVIRLVSKMASLKLLPFNIRTLACAVHQGILFGDWRETRYQGLGRHRRLLGTLLLRHAACQAATQWPSLM